MYMVSMIRNMKVIYRKFDTLEEAKAWASQVWHLAPFVHLPDGRVVRMDSPALTVG